MKVLSASPTSAGAPANARWLMVVADVHHLGAGQSLIPLGPDNGREVIVMGQHKAPYYGEACPGPGPGFDPMGVGGVDTQVFSGAQQKVNFCFEVAANDVSTLVTYMPVDSPGEPAVQFALR